MNPPPEYRCGMNTERAKREFIDDLCRNFARSVKERVHDMPWEWNGLELRQWLADDWKNAGMTLQRLESRSRLRKFRKVRLAILQDGKRKEQKLASEPGTLIKKNRWAKNQSRK